jgi:hypothetical protein
MNAAKSHGNNAPCAGRLASSSGSRREARDAEWIRRRRQMKPVTLLPIGDLAAQLEKEATQAREAEWRRLVGTTEST